MTAGSTSPPPPASAATDCSRSSSESAIDPWHDAIHVSSASTHRFCWCSAERKRDCIVTGSSVVVVVMRVGELYHRRSTMSGMSHPPPRRARFLLGISLLFALLCVTRTAPAGPEAASGKTRRLLYVASPGIRDYL